VRGGAIPLLAWGTVLLVLYVGNWIWEGRLIQAGPTVYAVLAVYACGVLLWLRRGEAIKPGPPPPRTDPEAVPEASIAAVLIGLSVGMILFGVVWAQFLVYFGAAVLLLSLGRLALELRSERSSRDRAGEELRP
jgi:hypothetical protein